MEIERLTKAGLDVHAHVETYACSGGYLLASCCNTISCTRWAKVGSIGVVIEFLNYSKLLSRVGVENLQLTAGKMKRTVSQMSEVTSEKKKYVEETLVRTHEEFKAIIRKNRPQIEDETCQGQVWSAMEALEKDMGLIDEIISYPELIERLSQTFTVQEVKVDEVKDFPFNPLELFSKAFKGLREPVMSLLGSNAMMASSLVEPSATSSDKGAIVNVV